MAAMLSSKRVAPACPQRAQARAAVRVSAQKQGDAPVQVATIAAIAAAALLHAAPAQAGVILEQPKLKKVLQEEPAPAAPKPAPKKKAPSSGFSLPSFGGAKAPAPSASTPAPKKAAAEESSSDGFDPKSVALPGSLVAIAGGAVVLSKVDEGFLEFMDATSCKNSASDGAGYEPVLKGDGSIAMGKKAPAGTKRVKAAKSAAASPLSTLFGSKEE